jgi:hypothetical protein
MSSLREAMIRTDAAEEQDERIARTWGPEAVGRELTALEEPDPALAREAERQAREDEYASWAMEIIVRARQRIGRTKWSAAEGVAKRRIVEALRCLPSDD